MNSGLAPGRRQAHSNYFGHVRTRALETEPKFENSRRMLEQISRVPQELGVESEPLRRG